MLRNSFSANCSAKSGRKSVVAVVVDDDDDNDDVINVVVVNVVVVSTTISESLQKCEKYSSLEMAP